MAYRPVPVRAGKVRTSSIVLRTAFALALGTGVYMSAIPGTGGHLAVDAAVPSQTASISYDADAPVISGSVASLFNTPIFVGANTAAKTDRARPRIDVAAFSQSFEDARMAIAEARVTADPLVTRQSAIAVADAEAEEEGPRISVASISPQAFDSEALNAIGAATGAAGDPSIPRPISVPDTLAFARSNTPATDFTPLHAYSEREQWCLATGIYFEARGESYRGQVAVAQVIMNRVEHPNYPNTICGVVYQNQHRRNACQFSFACDGIPDRINEPAAWAQAQEITQEVLNEKIYLTDVADATHYHATYVRPHWARNMVKLSQVGLHVFYRFRPGWQFG